MTQTVDKTTSPPYVSPVTFSNVLEGLRVLIPSRIDKSLVASHSGQMKTQLMATFRYLRLMDEDGTPQPILRAWVNAEKDAKPPIVLEVLKSCYPFLTDPAFSLAEATSQGLDEEFKKMGISGTTIRKCVAFFLALARDAGLEVSPYIKASKTGSGTPGPSSGQPRRRAKAKGNTAAETITKIVTESVPADLYAVAMGKLPEFNPEWNEGAQTSWLKAIDRILAAKGTPEK